MLSSAKLLTPFMMSERFARQKLMKQWTENLILHIIFTSLLLFSHFPSFLMFYFLVSPPFPYQLSGGISFSSLTSFFLHFLLFISTTLASSHFFCLHFASFCFSNYSQIHLWSISCFMTRHLHHFTLVLNLLRPSLSPSSHMHKRSEEQVRRCEGVWLTDRGPPEARISLFMTSLHHYYQCSYTRAIIHYSHHQYCHSRHSKPSSRWAE